MLFDRIVRDVLKNYDSEPEAIRNRVIAGLRECWSWRDVENQKPALGSFAFVTV